LEKSISQKIKVWEFKEVLVGSWSYLLVDCECLLPTPFEKDEQKSITTGYRICCYKINKLAFQAIGLLILFVRNWQCLKTEILTFLYHLPSHPQVVIIGSIYTHDH
jgi:hypothetical protein